MTLAVVILLAVIVIPSVATSVSNADSNAVISGLISKIKSIYSEYYTVPSITADIINIRQVGGNTVYRISVSLSRVLLAESASELPYVQGMLSEASKLNSTCRSAALSDLSALVNELENEYIVKEQGENCVYEVAVPSSKTRTERINNSVYSVYDENGSYPIEALRPASASTLREEGCEQARAYTESSIREQQSIISAYEAGTQTRAIASTAQDYNRINARNYIRTYCCNSGLFHTCPFRNTAYTYYNADCANYVSQAIYAGGISTDSTWNPGTQSWVNVGAPYNYSTGLTVAGVTSYMLDKGFFFQTTNKLKAFAGSIVYFYGRHVGMVDQNDTVTMTYCAHNACHKQTPFASWWEYGFSGTFVYNNDTYGKVSFFVPVWDSYANNWTPQT